MGFNYCPLLFATTLPSNGSAHTLRLVTNMLLTKGQSPKSHVYEF
jgi:hypothetical protein